MLKRFAAEMGIGKPSLFSEILQVTKTRSSSSDSATKSQVPAAFSSWIRTATLRMLFAEKTISVSASRGTAAFNERIRDSD